jgi:hypothetical protein
MQTIIIGWKSGKTTDVPLWDLMEGAWLWTLYMENMYVVSQLWIYSKKDYLNTMKVTVTVQWCTMY